MHFQNWCPLSTMVAMHGLNDYSLIFALIFPFYLASLLGWTSSQCRNDRIPTDVGVVGADSDNHKGPSVLKRLRFGSRPPRQSVGRRSSQKSSSCLVAVYYHHRVMSSWDFLHFFIPLLRPGRTRFGWDTAWLTRRYLDEEYHSFNSKQYLYYFVHTPNICYSNL